MTNKITITLEDSTLAKLDAITANSSLTRSEQIEGMILADFAEMPESTADLEMSARALVLSEFPRASAKSVNWHSFLIELNDGTVVGSWGPRGWMTHQCASCDIDTIRSRYHELTA